MRYWQPDLRTIGPGHWLMFDGPTRLAELERVTVGDRHDRVILARAFTADGVPRFVGYFPHPRLAALVIWEAHERGRPRAAAGVRDDRAH